MSVVYIDVDKIHANDFNPNVMSEEKFAALVDFCQTHDADKLDPIWLRKDGIENYEVIDGEHRWKAAKEVGWKRLRSFVIDMDVDDAKAFNVRKNRERGRLDILKLARIIANETGTSEEIGKKYGFPNGSGDVRVRELRQIHENEEKILEYMRTRNVRRPLSHYKAMQILDELKREERDEITEEPSIDDFFSQSQLTNFLRRYATALKKNPLPNVQKDELEVAIEFFKRIILEKKITCPTCGEKHLQWRCGHEF